jgi:tRNA(Ile)-lysidine synthase
MTYNTNIKDPFGGKVYKTISQFEMLQKEDAVLVGVSGGPDSVTLVRILIDLKEQYNLTLGIAHLNHSLRGEESQRDEDFVKDLAREFCLPFFTKKIEIVALAKQEHLSLEEAGRNARYAFFTQLAKTNGFTKIATGHNHDDNAEQVLMNLLRGSGPGGLAGIPPIRENRFIRPLIQIPKSEILSFLKEKNHPFVLDSSNTDESFLRNKIRHNLIPRLEKDFNPEIKSGLNRLSHILQGEEDFLTGKAFQAFNSCMVKKDEETITLSIPLLTQNHPAIVNRVLRLAIALVKKDLKRITLTHIRDILDLMERSETGKSIDLPGQVRVYKRQKQLVFQKETLPLRRLGRTQKQFRRGETQNPKDRN